MARRLLDSLVLGLCFSFAVVSALAAPICVPTGEGQLRCTIKAKADCDAIDDLPLARDLFCPAAFAAAQAMVAEIARTLGGAKPATGFFYYFATPPDPQSPPDDVSQTIVPCLATSAPYPGGSAIVVGGGDPLCRLLAYVTSPGRGAKAARKDDSIPGELRGFPEYFADLYDLTKNDALTKFRTGSAIRQARPRAGAGRRRPFSPGLRQLPGGQALRSRPLDQRPALSRHQRRRRWWLGRRSRNPRQERHVGAARVRRRRRRRHDLLAGRLENAVLANRRRRWRRHAVRERLQVRRQVVQRLGTRRGLRHRRRQRAVLVQRLGAHRIAAARARIQPSRHRQVPGTAPQPRQAAEGQLQRRQNDRGSRRRRHGRGNGIPERPRVSYAPHALSTQAGFQFSYQFAKADANAYDGAPVLAALNARHEDVYAIIGEAFREGNRLALEKCNNDYSNFGCICPAQHAYVICRVTEAVGSDPTQVPGWLRQRHCPGDDDVGTMRDSRAASGYCSPRPTTRALLR